MHKPATRQTIQRQRHLENTKLLVSTSPAWPHVNRLSQDRSVHTHTTKCDKKIPVFPYYSFLSKQTWNPNKNRLNVPYIKPRSIAIKACWQIKHFTTSSGYQVKEKTSFCKTPKCTRTPQALAKPQWFHPRTIKVRMHTSLNWASYTWSTNSYQ